MNKLVITPLGTISPYPKDNMNCPGYLIEYHDQKILIDCGSGITRLLRFPHDLKNLNVIITHYHKDHFADIGSLQYASFVYHNLGELNNKIKIYLPKKDIGFNKKAIISNKECYAEYYDIEDKKIIKLDDLSIQFKDNKSHTIESFMVKIENKDFKIIYTSDIGTTNFNELIDYCANADLIICESSFLEKHNAHTNTHMTAKDAALLAKESYAKKLLLTHFWPEEDKTLYLKEAKLYYDNIEIAQEGNKIIII